MKTFGPPGSFAMPQAGTHPNPSANNQGHAPSLVKHANVGHVPKYASNLAHVNGAHHIGERADFSNPLTAGFSNRGFKAVEQAKTQSHPIIGAGRGPANPHKDYVHAQAKMGKAEKQSAIESHYGAPKARPPHSMHPDKVKNHSDSRPKMIPAGHFGNKAMLAGAKHAPKLEHQQATFRAGPGSKPTLTHPSHAQGIASGGGKSLAHAGQNPHPKVMPVSTREKVGLPTFHKGAGAAKPQPARKIENPISRTTHALTAPAKKVEHAVGKANKKIEHTLSSATKKILSIF